MDPITEEIKAANEARRAHLTAHGIAVPMDQMYVVSLLEYLIGDDLLEDARAHHERRVAPILDGAIGKLQQAQEQMADMQAEAEERAREQQARETLLRPL